MNNRSRRADASEVSADSDWLAASVPPRVRTRAIFNQSILLLEVGTRNAARKSLSARAGASRFDLADNAILWQMQSLGSLPR